MIADTTITINYVYELVEFPPLFSYRFTLQGPSPGSGVGLVAFDTAPSIVGCTGTLPVPSTEGSVEELLPTSEQNKFAFTPGVDAEARTFEWVSLNQMFDQITFTYEPEGNGFMSWTEDVYFYLGLFGTGTTSP